MCGCTREEALDTIKSEILNQKREIAKEQARVREKQQAIKAMKAQLRDLQEYRRGVVRAA